MTTQARSKSEGEEDRLEILDAMLAERGPNWLAGYKPGSYGCHELLDRTSLVADLVEESVLTHPACALNPEWYALAEQAATCLRDLYQLIGAEHLNADGLPIDNS
jgi:hypothetical protein